MVLLAGHLGGTGSADGTGTAARFNNPVAVTPDGCGNFYVADAGNGNIRKISSTGVVTTVGAMLTQAAPTATGVVLDSYGFSYVQSNMAPPPGTQVLSYDYPRNAVKDASGNTYAVNNRSDTIVQFNAGVATIFAGTPNQSGYGDGAASSALFNGPYGVALDGSGNVYVADQGNSLIREISGGTVSTLAGAAQVTGSSDGTGAAALFNNPAALTVDSSGNVYVADTSNNTIRRVTSAGVVTTLAGAAGQKGSADGTGSAASFYGPYSLVPDASNNLYVVDRYNSTIRKVTPAGVVTTFAGAASGPGSADGTGASAYFNNPAQVAADVNGNVYVADSGNNTIREITPAGVVTTLAGQPGVKGSTDGTGSAALFNGPAAIAVDGSGNVYVGDTFNYTIRKITPAGVVTTLAGLAGSPGVANGTGSGARFSFPYGVAVDASGNVYVADTSNDTIRKITPSGVVTTLAGAGGLSGSSDGTGAGARFSNPHGVAVDASGNVYVADSGNSTVRKITPAGVVTTLAGLRANTGAVDGTGSAARFNVPYGITVDASGNLFVADTSNSAVREVTPAGVVTTVIGQFGQVGVQPGPLPAALNDVVGIAVLPNGQFAMSSGSENAVLVTQGATF